MVLPYYIQKDNLIRISVLTAITVACFLVVPTFSTPLYACSSDDYNVFVVMAQGWMEGLIPYRDLFDHKGPLLYLLQIAGLIIAPGKLGIWILETLFAVIFLELLYQCRALVLTSTSTNYTAVAVALLILLFTMQGGNNNEEWCLPFQALPLLLTLKFLKGGHPGIKTVATVCGACFGLVAMIRLNNNVIIAGICLGQMIIFLHERQYGELLKSALFFILGTAIAILPFFIYFYSVDALDDMLYANFLFNVKYKMTWVAEYSSKTGIRYLWPCIVLPLMVLIFRKEKKWQFCVIMIAVGIVTFATFITGTAYLHYYILASPIGALCILSVPKSWRIIPNLAVAAIVLGPILSTGVENVCKRIVYICNRETIVHRCHSEIITSAIRQHIPVDERKSIYLSMSPGKSSVLSPMEIFPTGKYFFLQYWLWVVDDRVSNDITKQFIYANPRWIISNYPIEDIHPLKENANLYSISTSITVDNCNYYFYRRND